MNEAPAGVSPGSTRPPLGAALAHSAGLAIAVVVAFEISTHGVGAIYSISASDDRVGGMWAVIATVFVYGNVQQGSVQAASARIAGTVLSCLLCLGYLAAFPFHPWALGVLIGVQSLVLMLLDRIDLIVTAGATTAVLLVLADLNPHETWQQPLLRIVDTALGVAVGVAAAWIAARGPHRHVGNAPPG